MNIFKGLLFLEGYLTSTEFADELELGGRYGSGNASARQFGAKREPRREPAVASLVAGEQPAACGCG